MSSAENWTEHGLFKGTIPSVAAFAFVLLSLHLLYMYYFALLVLKGIYHSYFPRRLKQMEVREAPTQVEMYHEGATQSSLRFHPT